MSQARPMGLFRRLDSYADLNGGDEVPLTPAQDRRRIHKERRQLGTMGGVWIYASRAKNRPTPRRASRVTRIATRG